MLDVDATSVLRAAGLIRAFESDDHERWASCMAAQEGDSAYRTFCTFVAFVSRALDWLEYETGSDRDELLTHFTTEFVKLAQKLEAGSNG